MTLSIKWLIASCTADSTDKVAQQAKGLARRVEVFAKATPPLVVAEDVDRILIERWNEMPEVTATFADAPDSLLCGRSLNSSDHVVRVGENVQFGGGAFSVIAGPCGVESESQMAAAAAAVKDAGAHVLRGGAFKPRTSPYAFQGLGAAGLELLRQASVDTDLPVVTEVLDTADIELVAESAQMLQVGARNMQNFALLKALGGAGKPVLLKRGFGCTLHELLCAAEYICAHGNPDVVLCERGVRSFDRETRFLFDVSAIAVLKERSRLPVIADPSHATGARSLVAPVARAALAAGADGVMVEVHTAPKEALSDGEQALLPADLQALNHELAAMCQALGRRFGAMPDTFHDVSAPSQAGDLKKGPKTQTTATKNKSVTGANHYEVSP